jgi:hypothetical protein
MGKQSFASIPILLLRLCSVLDPVVPFAVPFGPAHPLAGVVAAFCVVAC